ncbi:hypothetical protein [Curtobacterium sp. MCJR17_043]|uniref:hypothetical protein n=1 Tax=Curtobacterium sp. MCJR17_043 TaxID=2175660 RepID=UPI0024DF4826|nr:hypothetical protein [Curtobacterium sp. MCJR17_043]WIB37208.1 hypothetical protein DEJ15_15385 [Curtobacterium sp. MCJR17_043]
MKNQHLVRLGSAALAFGIITTTVAGSLLVVTAPASATAPTDSSAMTLTWEEAQASLGGGQAPGTGTPDPDAETFSGMTFRVSQTEELTDQGITVSWSGAKTTSPSEYATDYVQIMQCWGDDPAGPSPAAVRVGCAVGRCQQPDRRRRRQAGPRPRRRPRAGHHPRRRAGRPGPHARTARREPVPQGVPDAVPRGRRHPGEDLH